MLILWQAVADIVVVTLFRHEDMHLDLRMSRQVESTHRDRYPVVLDLVDGVKEKGSPTIRTKPTPYLFRRRVPSNIPSTVNCDRATRNVGRDKIMSRMLAALRAMAGVRLR